MKSKVYFTNMRAKSYKTNLLEKLGNLFSKAGFPNILSKNDLTAIKLHFGEKGNTTFLNPVFAARVVEEVKKAGAKPFLTDTNTLYAGQRANSIDHIQTALENGFSYATVKAPIIIADGITSKNTIEVEIKQKHFQKVKIASDIYYANSMIVLSHFKGHEMAGFGGAIKNLAMGCASAAGKQQQHSTVKPRVGDKCVGCTTCLKWCPKAAINIVEKRAEINHDICIGCGECISSCPSRVISPQWDTNMDMFIERLTEYALGAVVDKENKIGYINFVMNVTPECDCAGWSDIPLVPDVGILASFDPVAIDKASFDLVNQQVGYQHSKLTCNHHSGEDKFRGVRKEINAEIQFNYGQEIGLGSTDYELIEI